MWSSNGTGYEYLFTTEDPLVGDGSEPPANSLFNIQNMQMLVNLGESTPNILTNNTEVYNSTFTLPSGWMDLTATLGFDTQEQTYLLWLWLYYAGINSFDVVSYSNTVASTSNYGYMGQLGSEYLEEWWPIMNLEVPLFTMASAMNMSYVANNTNCDSFYTTTLGFDAAMATTLCADPSNTFNFVQNTTDNQDYFLSSVALMTVYYYGNGFNTANASYFDTFSNLTGWNSTEIDTNFRTTGTGMAGFANYVQLMAWSWYNTQRYTSAAGMYYTVCQSNYYYYDVNFGCAWSDLSVSQWLNSQTSFYAIQGGSWMSYLEEYKGYSWLTMTIEMEPFYAAAGKGYYGNTGI